MFGTGPKAATTVVRLNRRLPFESCHRDVRGTRNGGNAPRRFEAVAFGKEVWLAQAFTTTPVGFFMGYEAPASVLIPELR